MKPKPNDTNGRPIQPRKPRPGDPHIEVNIRYPNNDQVCCVTVFGEDKAKRIFDLAMGLES